MHLNLLLKQFKRTKSTRCTFSQTAWCCEIQIWFGLPLSAHGLLSWRHALWDHPTCGERHRWVRLVADVRGGKKQSMLSSEGSPSGAGAAWMPPKHCYFISLMENNKRCTLHHLSWGVIIYFPTINSSMYPPSIYVSGWPSVFLCWKGNKTNPRCPLSGCWARWSQGAVCGISAVGEEERG